MCGIFGWIRFDRDLRDDELSHARAATLSLAHRGPDHQGEWHQGSVFMGHRRLSILDLSPHAHQPFHDPEGRHVLCYNGEVYNYLCTGTVEPGERGLGGMKGEIVGLQGGGASEGRG